MQCIRLFFQITLLFVLQENADPHCGYPKPLPVTPVKQVGGGSPPKRERKTPLSLPDPVHYPTPIIEMQQDSPHHPRNLPTPILPIQTSTPLKEVELAKALCDMDNLEPLQPIEQIEPLELIEPVQTVDPVEADPVEVVEVVEEQMKEVDPLDLSMRKLESLSFQADDVKVSSHQLQNILQYNISIHIYMYIYIL
jgi:hypothetical protein